VESILEIGFKAIWQGFTPERKQSLCKRLGTSFAVLSHIANGHRNASPKLAKRMVVELRGMGVSCERHDLRPDIW
jgi:hypothetical protein